jgi:dihydroneopterin aldolase
MGQLVLNNMEFYAYHGHFTEERKIGGRFSVDIVIETDFQKAAITDDLNDAVDYSKVYEAVRQQMAEPSNLIEHLASRIVDAIYLLSSGITKVTATVSKHNPAIGGHMSRFSVILTK